MIDAKTLMEMRIEEAVSPYRSYAAKLKKMVSELQKQNYLIEEENHQLRKENSQLRASLQRLNRQVNQLQQKLSEVEEEWEMDKKRLYELEKKNKEYKEKMLSSLGDQLYLLTTSYLDVLKEVALQTQKDKFSEEEIERIYEIGKENIKKIIEAAAESPYALQLYHTFARTLHQVIRIYQFTDPEKGNANKQPQSQNYYDKLSEIRRTLTEYIGKAPKPKNLDSVALLVHYYEMDLTRMAQISLINDEEEVRRLIKASKEALRNFQPKSVRRQ